MSSILPQQTPAVVTSACCFTSPAQLLVPLSTHKYTSQLNPLLSTPGPPPTRLGLLRSDLFCPCSSSTSPLSEDLPGSLILPARIGPDPLLSYRSYDTGINYGASEFPLELISHYLNKLTFISATKRHGPIVIPSTEIAAAA
jgi:hypothetical protein